MYMLNGKGGKVLNQNKDYHIIYASDDAFAEILGISMISLFENNTDSKCITVYILDDGISEKNKSKLNSISERYDNSKLIWIEAINIEEILEMSVQVDRKSISQYARIFMSRVLPREVKRVLYLDCDVIINSSLEELWNLDLQSNTIGALKDAFSKQYRSNIGLKPNDIMFNSGVMLVNLELWRQRNVEERVLNFIIKNKGKIQQGDQGALNAVLCHEVYCFEPKFNSVSIFFDFTYEDMLIYRKPPDFYNKDEVMEAVNNPVIIHFTTSFLSKRPWIDGCEHRYKHLWYRYKQISPWRESANYADKSSKLLRCYLKLFDILPQKVALRVSAILQAYLRPYKFKILSTIDGISSFHK